MRRRLIPVLIAGLLVFPSPQPVQAGAFATEFTQLLNQAQLDFAVPPTGTATHRSNQPNKRYVAE